MQAFAGFLAILTFLTLQVVGIMLLKVAVYEIPASMPNLTYTLSCLGLIMIMFGLYFFLHLSMRKPK